MAGAFGRRDALRLALAAFALLALATPVSQAADDFIILQSTTSTQNSGLFEHILPLFTKKAGIEVRVVAVGTGQALKNAEKGDGDVVLVHSEPDEEKFVADGWGVKRYPVMYNDFIIVGPAADPAKIAGIKQAPEALKKIAEAQAPFASRADDSGTHLSQRPPTGLIRFPAFISDTSSAYRRGFVTFFLSTLPRHCAVGHLHKVVILIPHCSCDGGILEVEIKSLGGVRDDLWPLTCFHTFLPIPEPVQTSLGDLAFCCFSSSS
jgi:PBP superfamily domain